MKNTKNINNIKHKTGLRLVLAGLVLCFAVSPVWADENPFDIEGGHWMSFDHYKDADKRGHLPVPSAEQADTATPVDMPAGVATPAVSVNVAPVIAAPSRPIDLPVMPGLNKGFNVQVNSTTDDHPPSVTTNSEAEHIAPVSDKNWQSPVSVQTVKKSDDDENTDIPLNVRLSYLPNQKITPVASADHASAQKAGHVALEKILAEHANAAKTPAEAAACAAIDAYKKQQLVALQSDRQTLKALQDAIHSLGLDKQLDFMQGSDSALNVSGPQNVPTTIR